MIKFITTFSENDYHSLGKKLIDDWGRYMPNIELLVMLENPSIVNHVPKNVKIKEFNSIEHKNFIKKWKTFSKEKSILPDGRYEYRLDVVRFCHKVFAIYEGMKFLDKKDQLYVWWDSDAFPIKKVTKNYLKSKLSPLDYIATYLGREGLNHSETGFIAFNMTHPLTKSFITEMKDFYVKEKVFEIKEGWTDCNVFDTLRYYYQKEKKAKFNNISKDIKINDVWPFTWLAEFSVHHKGFKRKIQHGLYTEKFRELEGEKNMQRYKQIFQMIEHFKPQIITEIGVANGDRAEEMVRTALKHNESVIYFGFDLFEDLTEEISKEEFNGKKVPPMEEVNKRLLNIQKENPGFFFLLYKGNTREILSKVVEEYVELANQEGHLIKSRPYDTHMVFIDGGHSIETIKNDYEHFKHVPLIVFDDFYVPDESGQIPDIKKWGCNFLASSVPNGKVLPISDPVKGGGKVRLMVAGELAKYIQVEEEPQQNNENEKQGGKKRATISPEGIDAGGKNVKIETRNAVPDEEIQHHVDYACRLMKRFNIPEVPICETHDNWAVTVGGSPSYKERKFLNRIKEFSKLDDHVLFTSKSAHDFLINKNIIPWACILLDPRPHVAKSFTVHPDVLYIVASQCHPDVFDYLLDNNAKIMVYHAAVAAGETKVVKNHFPAGRVLPGGSTSQTRGLLVLLNMGFHKFKMFGIDSSYPEKPEEVHGINKKKEPFQIGVTDERSKEKIGSFWVDAELIAQINDMEHIMKTFPFLTIEVHGKGLMDKLFHTWKPMKSTFSRNYDNMIEHWKNELNFNNELLRKREKNIKSEKN